MQCDVSCLCFCVIGSVITIAVSLWLNVSVQLLSLNFDTIWIEKIRDDIVPRSLLHANFQNDPNNFLFIGLGDGGLLTLQLNEKFGFAIFFFINIKNRIQKRNHRRLGTQSVTLTPFVRAAKLHVFASCDRPTVIYNNSLNPQDVRLVYANANIPSSNFMVTPLNFVSNLFRLLLIPFPFQIVLFIVLILCW